MCHREDYSILSFIGRCARLSTLPPLPDSSEQFGENHDKTNYRSLLGED